MKNWIIASGTIALIGLVTLFIVTAPTDEQLIREALDESVLASREGRPNPVLDNLARTFTWNSQTVGIDRSEVSRIVRLGKPEIDLGQYRPEIQGAEATIVTDVHFKMDYQGYRVDKTLPGVEIKLRRVSGTRWLVLPSSRWKIYEVKAPI